MKEYKLNPSHILFNPEEHAYYTEDGFQLHGITDMLHRQLFPTMYAGVPDHVLSQAAERGKQVHDEAGYIDQLGLEPLTDRGRAYIALKEQYNLVHAATEYIVTDGEIFASPIDKVYATDEADVYDLADIKTTYALNRDYVRWQLSIYAYLFELQNSHAKVRRLYAIWLRDGHDSLVEVERISSGIIRELLTCEREGRQFVDPLHPDTDKAMPARYAAMVAAITEIVDQAKYWADKEKELREQVMKEMVAAGVYEWVCEGMKFTRVKESVRKTFDSAKFKADNAELYKQYLIEKPTAGFVKITIDHE